MDFTNRPTNLCVKLIYDVAAIFLKLFFPPVIWLQISGEKGYFDPTFWQNSGLLSMDYSSMARNMLAFITIYVCLSEKNKQNQAF